MVATLFGGVSAASAQSEEKENHRFVTRTIMYGIGSANVFDTYLSPQEYKGTDFRLSRETMRLSKHFNDNVSIQSFIQANIAYTHNQVNNNNTFSGLINWNHGMHYQFRLTKNFKLLAGGVGDFNGGFVYNLRNGNNPASARAYINLDASGMAIWHLKIMRRPITLRYQLNVPVVGVMFSPHYEQSYYEIFTVGNAHGVIQLASLHKQPSLRQMLSVDIPIGNCKVRLSYLSDLQQSRLNSIDTHTYGHAFMVGFVKKMYKIPNKSSFKPTIEAY
jgi:hypothetical protein